MNFLCSPITVVQVQYLNFLVESFPLVVIFLLDLEDQTDSVSSLRLCRQIPLLVGGSTLTRIKFMFLSLRWLQEVPSSLIGPVGNCCDAHLSVGLLLGVPTVSELRSLY